MDIDHTAAYLPYAIFYITKKIRDDESFAEFLFYKNIYSFGQFPRF